jgi:hypothetical protein
MMILEASEPTALATTTGATVLGIVVAYRARVPVAAGRAPPRPPRLPLGFDLMIFLMGNR